MQLFTLGKVIQNILYYYSSLFLFSINSQYNSKYSKEHLKFDSTDSNIKQTTTFDPNIFLYFDNESTDQLGYYIYTNMSRQHQVEIYTYTLTVLNLTLKVKFPCRIYLEHQGKGVTNQVQATNNNKFIFNQQVTLKNQTEKEHIELVVQLITEKGAKYVGGVVKLVQKQLIGSEGQCISIPIIKCLDPEAACEVRVDQVASSRISKKDSPKGKNPLRSQYHHEFNILSSKKKPHFNQEGETKSQYNFPISLNRAKDKADYRKQPMIVINSVRKGKGNESMIMQRQQTMSMVGGTAMSALQFEVYKEGYNKLKDKYRKEAEVARAQMSKRVALQTSQNNLKLQMMRYKLKAEELQKNLTQKSQKIKDLSENISILQKKQLDSKYLKQQIENKAHTIKSLEETIKGLNKDNSQLKRLQLEKYQTDQQTWTNLKEDMQKLKNDHEYRQAQLQRQIKLKIDIIGKKEYEYSSKCEELERARCNIEDLQKSLSIKTFQWQKVLQNERGTAKVRQQQLKQKRNSVEQQRNKLDQRLNQFTQLIQELKTQISKLQYEKKISNQNYESIVKQNEDLKIIKDKYTELTKQLKKTLDEKKDLQKSKQRQVRQKSIELDELTIKYTLLLDLYKKSTKQWDEKQKNFQSKQSQSTAQIQSNNNFIQKLKRQNQNQAKELNQLKAYLKDLKNEIKGKDDKILLLTNELTDSKNKSNQSDYSVKIQLARTKEDLEKMTNKWKQAEAIALASNESNGNLQLLLNKSKVEYQFKQQKLSKELGYAKDKISSLEIVKSDLDNQIASLSLTITNFKQNEKGMIQKIQRLELESIKTKESQQKMKKEIKILEQKGQNNQASIKNKQKQITDILLGKQSLKKKTAQLQVELGSLKNELNKQISQKQRYQKISEILQGDLNKAKEEHTRLNELIVTRQNIQNGLRQQLKKEKQDFTKLDMKLNASKKQFQKFKETLVQNLNTVFSSIPEGSFAQSKIKSTVIQKSGTSKENSEVLNLLISYGRQTRNNVVKTLQQLKQAVRDNEKLSSDYSLSVNKFNTNQFEYSQGITAIQQQLSQLLQQKQIEQNNYEQEIFLLEGRVKQKEMLIYELTQQVQQLDYTLKNIKGQFQFFREDAQKKQITKNKLIQQLRDQIQYYRLEITTLEGHSEKLQSKYESTDQEFQNSLQLISRINKQLNQTKQSLQANEETLSNLRKQLKKTNDSKEQLALAFAQKQEQLKKSESTLQDQQKKSSELRDFVKQLMKQKEQVIKNELQKSENVLILQTTVEQLKHQIESLQESLKTTTKSQEQLKQTVKRLAKNLKEQQLSKNEQKMKNIKSNDRLKDKEKEIVVKDEIISKLQQKLRKEVEKKNRQIKQLEQQVDNTQIKLLNTERETSQKILNLENDIQRVSDQLQKTTQSLILTEQSLFKQKTRIAEQRQSINSLQKEIQQHKQRIQELTTKNSELDQQLRFSQQSSFKMQGKINLLEMKIQSKEKQHNQIVNNFNQDWSSKYYSMEDQYEQRLQLNNKQREFLKEKIAEYEKQSKRLLLQIKSSQNNSSSLKKNYQQKIKSLQQDRLTTIAQKNTENQRLVDDIRISSQNLKSKQTQCRKMSNQIQSLKASLLKTESRYRQAEEKIRNINRNHQIQLQELKKKQQSFKKLKEIVTSSIWKSQRQARRVIQTNIRQIIDIVDEKSTIKVMEIARQLQQNVITAISFKIDQKEI